VVQVIVRVASGVVPGTVREVVCGVVPSVTLREIVQVVSMANWTAV